MRVKVGKLSGRFSNALKCTFVRVTNVPPRSVQGDVATKAGVTKTVEQITAKESVVRLLASDGTIMYRVDEGFRRWMF